MMSSQTIMCAALVVMCLQPAVQGQRRYYNSYYNYGRSLGDNVDEANCQGITCGINAQCSMSGIRPACSCLPGCFGDPLSQCIRAECLDHTECRSFQACQNNRCINPCEGACGVNADCDVRNHLPECCCPPNYTGNPFTGCHIMDPGQRRYYNSYNNYERSLGYNVDEANCNGITCGINAKCTSGIRPTCSCLPGHSGNPLVQCIRPECLDHTECRSFQACQNNHCINACKGACGANANCDVRNHLPVCSCPPHYTGNPDTGCRIFDPEEYCHPNPCGSNTKCNVVNNVINCSCLPGYKGSGINGCRHECERDSDCNYRQVCSNFKCNSACNVCGVNAECETVVNHRAVCKCPTGYIGDPYRNCHPECTGHSECPSYKPVCRYNKCTDPCKGFCGTNADCNLRELTPVCSCPRNMTGDPYSFCRPFEPRDLCEPNPCGLNAQCIPGHDRTGKERPVCNCLPGYVGKARVSCQRGECQLDDECPDHKACVGYACVDPCIGQCASTSQCNARRHIAVCTCPGRTLIDKLVSCRVPIDVPAGRSLRYY